MWKCFPVASNLGDSDDKLKSELTTTANSLAGTLRMMTKAETVLAEVEKEKREVDQKICQLVAGKWQVF